MLQTKGNTKKNKYQGSLQYLVCAKGQYPAVSKVYLMLKVRTGTNMHQDNAKGMKNQSTLFQVYA